MRKHARIVLLGVVIGALYLALAEPHLPFGMNGFVAKVEAIIGRDVLNRCNFLYLGPERKFNLAF